MDQPEAYSQPGRRSVVAPAEPSIGRALRADPQPRTARCRLQRSARVLFFLLAAGFAAEPVRSWAQTAQPSPPAAPGAPTTSATVDAATPPTLALPITLPGKPTLPPISDTTNPAALDYVIQYPMFGDLDFRKDLADHGIDLIAHYISETMSNTRGIRGTGTAYAQQVDFGASFDFGKLGGGRIQSDASR
jgi:hypothetical protein